VTKPTPILNAVETAINHARCQYDALSSRVTIDRKIAKAAIAAYEAARAKLTATQPDLCPGAIVTKPTPIIDAAAITAAARALCPRDPPAAWIEAMARAIKSRITAPLCSNETAIQLAIAAYRAQPLWQELWGEVARGSGK